VIYLKRWRSGRGIIKMGWNHTSKRMGTKDVLIISERRRADSKMKTTDSNRKRTGSKRN